MSLRVMMPTVRPYSLMTTAKSELSFLKRSSVSVSVSESGIVMMGCTMPGLRIERDSPSA